MKNIVRICLVLFLINIFNLSSFSENIVKNKDITVSNRFFSITLPEKFKDTYFVKKRKNGIFIYHKQSAKEGFGGFAFGVKIYKTPSEHAMTIGGRKIGELKTRKNLYDVVIIYPTDVQYNYTKQVPESYKNLYNYGEIAEIKGRGKNLYLKDSGMKGEDLYKEVLEKHLRAIKEKWDSSKLEQENMSYMYNVISQTNKDALNKTGFAYYDVNSDGIDELFIGEISEGSQKGVIYDIYTMKDRKPIHVISGGSRDRYFVCNDSFLCNEYSSSAFESGVRIVNLVENSSELFPQINFKYDEYENPKKPWFISYSDEKWENVSEKLYNERISTFEKYMRFDFTPFEKINIAK